MLRKLLFKFSGKEDKDPSVPTRLVYEQAIDYGFALCRGFFKVIGCKMNGTIFVGSRTKIVGKNNLVLGKNVNIGKDCFISCYSKRGITIGESSKIGDNSVVRCSNLQHLGEGLFIGDHSSFDAECFFGASGFIRIGNDVIAGRNIKFHAENHEYKDAEKLIREQGVSSKGIVIGNNCWIGSNVIFLDGSRIGDGCVVAAGAVVVGEYPNNTVIGGIPARVIKQRCISNEI